MSFIDDFRKEQADVEYCPYCYEPRGGKLSCCSEVHFIKFSEMSIADQMDIAQSEYEDNLYRSMK